MPDQPPVVTDEQLQIIAHNLRHHGMHFTDSQARARAIQRILRERENIYTRVYAAKTPRLWILRVFSPHRKVTPRA